MTRKRVLTSGLAALALAVAAAGCQQADAGPSERTGKQAAPAPRTPSGSPSPSPSETPMPPPKEEPEKPDPKFGQSYTFDSGLKVQLSKPRIDSLSSLDREMVAEQSVDTKAVFDVRITNGTPDRIEDTWLEFTDEARYGSGDTKAAERVFFPTGDLSYAPDLDPGKSTTARIAWLVPKDEADTLVVDLIASGGLEPETATYTN